MRHDAGASLHPSSVTPQLKDEVMKVFELSEKFEIVGHSYEQLIPYMITRCRGKIALIKATIGYSEDAAG